MKASEMRSEGINAPGNSYVGGSNDAANGNAIAINLGLLCGIGLEIAAQLAEANQPKLVGFTVTTANITHTIFINPSRVMAVVPRIKEPGTYVYVFMGAGADDYFLVNEEISDVVNKLRE